MTYSPATPVHGNPAARDAAMLAAGWTRYPSGAWYHRAAGIVVKRDGSGWHALAEGGVSVRGETLGSVAGVALAAVRGWA